MIFFYLVSRFFLFLMIPVISTHKRKLFMTVVVASHGISDITL